MARSLQRIHELQPILNAFTAVLDEQAMEAARLADNAVRRGGRLPPLLGVPVSVKDHIWMTGTPATNGSAALRDFVPPEDAVPVARLRAAGAVIVGKTNNPEFCYRGFTDNVVYGLTRNPWDLERTPGGSSGGAGSSVAAGMTSIAPGADGGGAWSADLGMLPVDADVRGVFAEALSVFADLGCDLVEAAPSTQHPTELWNTIALTEGYASEGPLLASWRDQMSLGTAEIIEAGQEITGSQYVDALHDKGRYTRVWSEFFQTYDLLLTPAMQLTAFPVGLQTPETIQDQAVDPFFDDWCTVCLAANLTGMPATSVPAGFGAGGRSGGLQIMGPRWADTRTLRAAAAFEQHVPWTRFMPTV